MIQGVISRMSGFSASAKTFTVTILAALAAISLQADNMQLGVIAILATIVLGIIDIYYLTLELRFRALYAHVEARSLNCAQDLAIKPVRQPGDVKRALNSKPTKLFYLPVFGACLLFICYGTVHEQWNPSKQLTGSNLPLAKRPTNAETINPSERAGRLAKPAADQSNGASRPLPEHPEPAHTR